MQYFDQLEPRLLKSVLGSVANWCVFRTGSADAEILESEFAPYVKTELLWRPVPRSSRPTTAC